MKTIDLSPQEGASLLEQILERNESRHLEFKRVSGKMVNKALESICAFSNTDGGILVLGLADPKEYQGQDRLFGVQENPEAVDELQRAIGSRFQQDIAGIPFRRLSCPLHNGPAKGQSGHLVLVSVPRSMQVHSVVNGGTFTRLSAGNGSMSAEAVTELSYRRGVRSATAVPPQSHCRCHCPCCRRRPGSVFCKGVAHSLVLLSNSCSRSG